MGTGPPSQQDGAPAREELYGFGGRPRGRVSPAVVIAALGLAVVVAVLVLSGGFDSGDEPDRLPGAAAVSPGDPGAVRTSGPVPRLEVVDAQASLHRFGDDDGPLEVPGEPSFAWSWNDRAGDHLLVLSAVRTHDDEAPHDEQDDSTLSTTLFRPEDGGGATIERQLVEPGAEPCSLGEPDGFLPDATRLSDTDGDGVSEVSVAWHYACSGELAPVTIKLALLEGQDKYLLRGTGFLDEQAARDLREQLGNDPDASPEPMSYTPEPGESSWGRGMYEHAVELWTGIAF